jgi:protein-disulfide isomerase-like protein with CxxC motif
MTSLAAIEYTDAMCSWAWGTEPKLRRLRWCHGRRLEWRRVMGGLVEDRRPPTDPRKAADDLEQYWAGVAANTGATHPSPLDHVPLSSHPSGRAVVAARRQGPDVEDRVLRRLREATFVWGDPPDTHERCLTAVAGLSGLDEARFAVDLASEEIAAGYQADVEQARRPNDHVLQLTGDRLGIGDAKESRDGRLRFAFPTVVFVGSGGEHTVPGWMPYGAYVEAMEAAEPGSTAEPRPLPSFDEALATWELLTATELEQLVGPGGVAPDGCDTHTWPGGTIHGAMPTGRLT